MFFKENALTAITLWEAIYLTGDKKLYDSYRLELDRILNRKENVQTRSLRQKRAIALLKTDIQEFVPKMNRDIDAEA